MDHQNDGMDAAKMDETKRAWVGVKNSANNWDPRGRVWPTTDLVGNDPGRDSSEMYGRMYRYNCQHLGILYAVAWHANEDFLDFHLFEIYIYTYVLLLILSIFQAI